MSKELHQRFENEFIPERIEKKIFAKVLVSQTEENEHYQEKDISSYRETRFLNHPIDFGCEVCLYASNTLLIALYNEKEMFAVIIESATVYGTLQVLFEHARNSSL